MELTMISVSWQLYEIHKKNEGEAVQIYSIAKDIEAIINSREYKVDGNQLKDLRKKYDLYKVHVIQNLTQVANQNFLLKNIVYSLKEEIKENSLKMKNLQERTNSDNSALKE